MTGLPKPSQVEGNTTASAAAYASTDRGARPTVTAITALARAADRARPETVLSRSREPEPDWHRASSSATCSAKREGARHSSCAGSRASVAGGRARHRRIRTEPVSPSDRPEGFEVERVADRHGIDAAMRQARVALVVDRDVQRVRPPRRERARGVRGAPAPRAGRDGGTRRGRRGCRAPQRSSSTRPRVDR